MQTPAQLPAATPLPVTQEASSPGATPTPEPPQLDPPPAMPLRPFVPPATKQTPVPGQGSVLALPPGTAPINSGGTIPGLSVELVKSVNGPVPPPAAPTQPAASAPAPAPKPDVSSGGRLQEPQLIDRTLPDFPALARQRGIFGAVRMEALVDEYGAVKNVTIVSGDPILAAAAKTAVLKWKYKPATLNGQPIAISVAIQVLFGDRNQ